MADITYCGHRECTSRECMRHYTHIPVGIPVSVAMFDCPYLPLDYFDGYVEVVRCGNCGRWERHTDVDRKRGHCYLYNVTKHESGYCDRGERRSDK